MKKLIASLVVIGSACAFAAITDTSVIVSTTGPDVYADGTPVVDGEYYALCWSEQQNGFAGILANGEPVNKSDVILGMFPAAKDGKCRLFKYDLPAMYYTEKGQVTLWLLDTRVYTQVETPEGIEGKVSVPDISSKITSVNGAVQVKASITVADAAVSGVSGDAAVRTAATAVPAGAPKPTIKSITVGKDLVEIVVTNTVPYLAYDLKSGATPEAVKASSATNAVNSLTGKADGEITIYAKKQDKAFFQVDRK